MGQRLHVIGSGEADSAINLWGTSWRLVDLAGSGVLDRANATLAFPEAGKARGNASCNRFRAAVTIQGETITFGPLATTRKACSEAVMNQESRYLAALREANRFRVDGPFLYIYTTGRQQPLRFIRAEVTTTRKAGTSQEVESAIATGPEIASPPGLTGIWTVVGHHIPGVSAMSDAEATARHGTTVRLTVSEALSPGNHCDAPTYATRTVDRDRFLASEYHLPPGSLTSLDRMQHVRLLEVSCGTQRWRAMGALLIEIAPDRALAPWDGVFFELARDHDFRAAGQEPFWHLEIRKGIAMRLARPGAPDVIVPAPVPTAGPSGAQTYHAVTEAHDLRVIIDPHPCTDIMSGKRFPNSVTIELDGTTYRGCGEPVP
jgi:heat shock protein HslJ